MRSKLKDVAEIRPGYQFRGRVEEAADGSYRAIQIRDFDEARNLDVSRLVRVALPPDSQATCVEPDDVLFLSRGHRLWAAAVETAPPQTVASGYFYILKPSAGVKPRYLAWLINQEPFQAALRLHMHGSHMPLVSRSDFCELEVDVPSLGVQDSVVALDALARREQLLLKSIQEKRAQLVAAVCMQAIARSSAQGK